MGLSPITSGHGVQERPLIRYQAQAQGHTTGQALDNLTANVISRDTRTAECRF